MANDRSERRGYRKSPGRQYGYDLDPMRSRNERSQSGRLEHSHYSDRRASTGETASRSGALLAQRPDPRRTRQLIRQNILASKARSLEGEEEFVEDSLDSQPFPASSSHPGTLYEQEPEGYAFERRHEQLQRSRSGYLIPTDNSQPIHQPPTTLSRLPDGQAFPHAAASSHRPSQSERRYLPPQLASTGELERGADAGDVWHDYPDVTYETYNGEEQRYVSRRGSGRLQEIAPSQAPGRARPTAHLPEYEDEEYEIYEDDEYDEEDEVPRRRKKGKLTRRAILFGAGAVAVAGAGYAVTKVVPNVPQALSDVGNNIEHQVEDAFKRGQDAARKELLTALENIEGATLEGAISAAKLTRIAYDVFVSPIIQIGSTISVDFLNAMLNALKVGRDWLARVYQDNATLAALQKVLESWVAQVSKMPMQLNAIAKTDLDGAQAYLRNLQRKIDEEKAKLNGQTTPTTTPGPTKQPTQQSTP